MTVRVIRVLEYSFPDQETAEKALAAGFVPANGVKFVGHTVIRSATTWPEQMPERSPEDEYNELKAQVEARIDRDRNTPVHGQREQVHTLSECDQNKGLVPCGNPDRYCGILGGSARCEGCKV
jgi:hypothetical protein